MATYNVVTDLGADDTGSTAIDSDIEPYVASGNTLVFPAGDYLLNSLTVGSTVSNFVLQGNPGANLIPKDYGDSSTSPWIQVQGSGFEWHQFNLEVNGRNPGPVDIEADNWELTRLITRGEVHAETDGEAPGGSGPARSWFSLWVNTSGATGLIEDCYFHTGSNQSVPEGSNRRAILVDGGQGDLTINRCWFENWGENTIYAKNPAGHLNVYNSYWRNTQNGLRCGGNTDVFNCLSIKDGPQPENWASSALQKGVSYEAEGTTDADRDQYSGLNNVKDCDFYHDYRSPAGEPDSCGAAIGGSSAPKYAEIHDCRIYYNSDRSHDAVYNGRSTQGDQVRWALDNVHINNDCPGTQYCVDVGHTPNNWGPVSGVWSAENGNYSTSSYVRSRFDTGMPDAPNTTPPLPVPKRTQPMADATVVTIDNTGNDSSSTYSFEGAPMNNTVDAGTIHPSGVGSADINMNWAGGSAKRRETEASGTVDVGEVHRYYIDDGGLVGDSFTQSGDASLTVEGTVTTATTPAYTWTDSAWDSIEAGDVKAEDGLTPAAMKHYVSSAAEWRTAVDRT